VLGENSENYPGEYSFSRVKKRLRKYYIKNGRLPKSTDENISSISNAISRGMFKEQGETMFLFI
jgi:selenophosphate synthase